MRAGAFGKQTLTASELQRKAAQRRHAPVFDMGAEWERQRQERMAEEARLYSLGWDRYAEEDAYREAKQRAAAGTL